jgi:hypothetical protein
VYSAERQLKESQSARKFLKRQPVRRMHERQSLKIVPER